MLKKRCRPTDILDSEILRVIINGISMHLSAHSCRHGIGDSSMVNNAVAKGLMELERVVHDGALGLTGRWYGYNVQIDRIS